MRRWSLQMCKESDVARINFLFYPILEWLGTRCHTSQTCSQCGHQHRSKRKSQSLFLCKHCGYYLNTDLNAAFNIRNEHLARLVTSLALASGSLSDGLSPHASA
ncbi:zinc ribbon domain-containing protein [Ktedonobacter racemifer]|uniref:zinc ribbon domain-containing protein n=1 Tax=Ktedonobacter racemifer TaxID=363277 RepID=UPI0009FE1481